MASITIRNLPDEVKKRLRLRAAERGRSMEEEAREILREKLDAHATASESGLDLFSRIHARFAPFGSVELQIPPREYGREPPDFDDPVDGDDGNDRR